MYLDVDQQADNAVARCGDGPRGWRDPPGDPRRCCRPGRTSVRPPTPCASSHQVALQPSERSTSSSRRAVHEVGHRPARPPRRSPTTATVVQPLSLAVDVAAIAHQRRAPDRGCRAARPSATITIDRGCRRPPAHHRERSASRSARAWPSLRHRLGGEGHTVGHEGVEHLDHPHDELAFEEPHLHVPARRRHGLVVEVVGRHVAGEVVADGRADPPQVDVVAHVPHLGQRVAERAHDLLGRSGSVEVEQHGVEHGRP